MKTKLVVVLALASLPYMAMSQETGTLMPHAAAQLDYQKTNVRVLTNRWARCVVSQSPGRVESYLALPTGGKASNAMARNFLSGESECLSGNDRSFELMTDLSVTRGALFEALYMRKFGRGVAPDLSVAPVVAYGWTGSDVIADAEQVTARARFGDCVVRRDAANARTLVASMPGSGDEKQAINTMMPHFSACLPRGQQFTFGKTLIRGAIAEPLYKLSLAVSKSH